MKVSTNWLKDFVTLPPPLERLAERLTMVGLEVKRAAPEPELKDTVFEVEVTTNRPDWLSHLGVAREIHALENTGLKIPPTENPGERPMPSGWKLELKEAEGCPYYTACLLEGVQANETPEWMKNRLLACGMRSIHLVVDITNYVLLEFGQPLHAFDADLLRGKTVEVRRAKSGENLIAIDGTRQELLGTDLVIADRERAVAIAGVMGGQETEVSGRTRNILLESAFFHPRWVRKTALRLGLASESSYRFERRVDPEGVDSGRERAIRLFRELAGVSRVTAVLKAGRKPTLPKPKLHLSLEEVEKVLGVAMKPHQVHSILTRLSLEPKNENPENWVVTVPSYRPDLERPVDLIEEIARLGGYEKIPESLPERPPLERKPNPLRRLEEATRNFFSGAGLFETVTSSLVPPALFKGSGIDLKGTVQIHNPINEELTLLRPSLLISLLEVLRRNERVGESSVLIFEIANCYRRKSEAVPPEEEKTLGFLLGGARPAGWKDAKRSFDFYDLKGILQGYLDSIGIVEVSFSTDDAPYFMAGTSLLIGKEKIGTLGEVSASLRNKVDIRSRAFFGELSLERVVRRLPGVRKVKEIPRFPPMERDLSVVVEESVKLSELVSQIEQLGQGLVRNVELFDLFRGGRVPKGEKNVALRITYQSPDKTLLSDEIQKLHDSIASEVAKKFKASFQEKR